MKVQPEGMSASVNTRRRVLVLSPIVVIGVGHLVARTGGASLGVKVWMPLALVFWASVSLFTRLVPVEEQRQWLGPSHGSGRWRWLALAMAATVLPMFLMNWRLIATPTHFVPWLVFGLANPWFEERYWRGALLHATNTWPTALRIGYTAAAFALSHPLMFGVHSIGVRSPAVLISTFIMGAAWALVAVRTRSLRWCMLAHVLVDLFSLSVVVFENVWVPPPTP
jgi:uncharacterized protein